MINKSEGISLSQLRLFVGELGSRFIRYVKGSWREILVESLTILAILVTSLRTYIFGHGYYEYADQIWPPTNQILPAGVFSPSPFIGYAPPIILQYTRDFLSWPYFVFVHLTDSSLIVEKLYVIYSFTIFLIACFILANIIFRVLASSNPWCNRFFVKEALKVFIVLLCYSNLAVINLNTNGGTSADGLIVVFMAISLIGLVTSQNRTKSVITASLLLSISLLLDPDYYPIYLIGVVGILSVKGIQDRRVFRSIKEVVMIVALSFPALVFIAYSLYVTNPSFLSGQLETFASFANMVHGRSANLSLSSAFFLLGEEWSTITYGPPSILLYGSKINQLNGTGFPTQVLLPPGPVTVLWFFAISMIPVAAFSSTLFRKTRHVSIPVTLVSLFTLSLTQYPKVPILLRLGYLASKIPFIGEEVSLPLSAPDHLLQLLAATYVILISIFIFNVLQLSFEFTHGFMLRAELARKPDGDLYQGSPQKVPLVVNRVSQGNSHQASYNRYFKRLLSLSSTILIVALLLLPGWQAFNGSFYPSRAYPPFNGGNNVPNASPFGPVVIPNSEVQAYDFLVNQPGNTAIYWPYGGMPNGTLGQGVAVFSGSDPPKVLASLPEFPFLMSQRLLGDIAPYLRSESVGYVVVQDYPSSVMLSVYGMPRFSLVISTLSSCPDILTVAVFKDIHIFEVMQSQSIIHPVSMILHSENSATAQIYAYSALASIGIPAAFVQSPNFGYSFAVNEPGANVSIVSPSYLALNTSLNDAHFVDSGSDLSNSTINSPHLSRQFEFSSLTNSTEGFVNTSQISSIDLSWTQGNGPVNVGNWTTMNWGVNPIAVNVSNGSVNLSFSNSTFATFGYNGTLSVNGVPGGITVQNADSEMVVANLSFLYRTSINYSGSLNAYFIADNSSAYNIGSFGENLSSSSTWTKVSYNTILPIGTKYFTIRIGAGSNAGTVELQNVNVSWTFLKQDLQAPFGDTVQISNLTLRLRSFSGVAYVAYMGAGIANDKKLNASMAYNWQRVQVTSDFSLSGNLSLEAILLVNASSTAKLESNALVYSMPYLQSYIFVGKNFTRHSIPTTSGTNLFLNVGSGPYSIKFMPESIIEYSYGFILVYLLVLLVLTINNSKFYLLRLGKRDMQ